MPSAESGGSLLSDMCRIMFGAGELCKGYPISRVSEGRERNGWPDLVLRFKKNISSCLLIPREISAIQLIFSFLLFLIEGLVLGRALLRVLGSVNYHL